MANMQTDLKRTKNGEPLPGTLALEDRIEQVDNQIALLTLQVGWLRTLRAELPDDLSAEAEAALAMLVTGGGR